VFWFEPTQQGDGDEVIDLIKDEIWPKPAFWYLGLADEDLEGGEFYDDEEEDDEDQ